MVYMSYTMRLGEACTLNLPFLTNTTVYWENNHASLGGAIYIDDASPISYFDPHIIMLKEDLNSLARIC